MSFTINKNLALISVLVWAGCTSNNSEKKELTVTKAINDTIPETRERVSQQAVASYSEPVKDPDGLNDWKFEIKAYETQATFEFLLKIQYMELAVTDSLFIPNFGIRPQVKMIKGPYPLSCVIGFLDKEGVFKEYKLVEVAKGQLKIRQIKSYRRAIFKKS
ncbi:hypothetical protein CLV98_101848 [Dyadobacter jejuensis]|uniref:Lipoprotein n=1 Tax=Dyadobacter jejuensis TaxID=1082580 RepID=A0A316ASI0_9BACT|nr:hypothetical protein [Dyadobacter jejuensis]PWJ60663.1 hypothetical protein CLV98_101848 [Dyadobacter jejuensis]